MIRETSFIAKQLSSNSCLGSILLKFLDSFSVQDILKDLTDDDFNSILQRTYIHDNGFYKIPLIKSTNFQLRIHYWSKEIKSQSGTSKQNAHDHRWDFASYILQGSYSHQKLVEESSASESLNHYIYHKANNFAGYNLQYNRLASLKVTNEDIYKKGDILNLNYEDIHRVSMKKYPVVTLVLCGYSHRNYTNIYSCQKIDRSVRFINEITSDELAIVIEDIFNLL